MKATKPSLWEAVKKKHRQTTAGTPKGRWGSTKAARAKLEYRKKGGRWVQSTTPPKARSTT